MIDKIISSNNVVEMIKLVKTRPIFGKGCQRAFNDLNRLREYCQDLVIYNNNNEMQKISEIISEIEEIL